MSEELTLPVYTEVERSRSLSHTSRMLYKRAQFIWAQNMMLQAQVQQHLKRLATVLHTPLELSNP